MKINPATIYCLKIKIILCFVLVIFASPTKLLASNNITASELIAKHLESIGTADARSKIKTRIMIGGVSATFRGAANGELGGRAILASENASNMLLMRFGSPDYPFEKVGFNGKELTVGFPRPGVRTELGNFLQTNDAVFRQGLMGGVLSSAWTLALTDEDAKIDYIGTSKIGDRSVHKLRYRPGRVIDLQVTLYFDTENFQHLRTQYEREVAPRLGATDRTSSSQRETRYKLVENYANFKRESGIMLPHEYTLQYSIDGNVKTLTYSWKINLEQFVFNRPIAESSFNVAVSADNGQ